jgi:hypothetical protein
MAEDLSDFLKLRVSEAAGGADIAFYVCDPFLRVATPDYPCSGSLVHCQN